MNFERRIILNRKSSAVNCFKTTSLITVYLANINQRNLLNLVLTPPLKLLKAIPVVFVYI